MTSVIGTASGEGGVVLRTRHWVPTDPGREPIASLLIVHGLGEHSGRWEHVGEHLASEQIEVYSFDLRGHGASSGRRIHVKRFSEFGGDVAGRLAEIRRAAPGRPVVLYGASLGGLIALWFVLRQAEANGGWTFDVASTPMPDLLVLSAPGLDSTIPAWKIRLASILGNITPTLTIPNRIDGALFSRDPSVGERYHGDPLVVGGATASFGAAALAEQAWTRGALRGLAIPTLVIHGEDDRLVPPSASAPLAEVAGVTRRTYPGIRHELHNEPEGPSIVADVIAWIREQVAPA